MYTNLILYKVYISHKIYKPLLYPYIILIFHNIKMTLDFYPIVTPVALKTDATIYNKMLIKYTVVNDIIIYRAV